MFLAKQRKKRPGSPFNNSWIRRYIYILHRKFTILELYDRLGWGMNFLQTYLSIIPQCFPFIRILIMPFNKRRNSRMVLHFFFSHNHYFIFAIQGFDTLLLVSFFEHINKEDKLYKYIAFISLFVVTGHRTYMQAQILTQKNTSDGPQHRYFEAWRTGSGGPTPTLLLAAGAWVVLPSTGWPREQGKVSNTDNLYEINLRTCTCKIINPSKFTIKD